MTTDTATPRTVDVRRVRSGQSWNAAGTQWEPIYSNYVLEDDYRALEHDLRECVEYARHKGACDKMKQMPIEGGKIYVLQDFEAWHEAQSCTCGLNALLARIKGTP